MRTTTRDRIERRLAEAHEVAAGVTDPEMPMLTLQDLGVLRSVAVDKEVDKDKEVDRTKEVDKDGDGNGIVVTITPTYSGCPAMATMRDDLVHRLRDHGFDDVRVAVSLHPAWSSDWITDRGRRALLAHGISAPGQAPRHDGPVALSLLPVRRSLTCPRCGSTTVQLTSEFGATACKAIYRCTSCLEPFEHVKEI